MRAAGRRAERDGPGGLAGGAMEEWRQCGRWLIDCKVLPANHRVVWPSAVVFELAQALRDGVLLCQLLHNLAPGSVDLKDINFRPQMSQVSSQAGRRQGDARGGGGFPTRLSPVRAAPGGGLSGRPAALAMGRQPGGGTLAEAGGLRSPLGLWAERLDRGCFGPRGEPGALGRAFGREPSEGLHRAPTPLRLAREREGCRRGEGRRLGTASRLLRRAPARKASGPSGSGRAAALCSSLAAAAFARFSPAVPERTSGAES